MLYGVPLIHRDDAESLGITAHHASRLYPSHNVPCVANGYPPGAAGSERAGVFVLSLAWEQNVQAVFA